MLYSDKKTDSPVLYASQPASNNFFKRARLRLPRWLPFLNANTSHYGTSSGRHLTLGSSPNAAMPSKKRIGAVVTLILLTFFFLVAKIRRGRSLSRLPFTEESTLVLEPAEIARVWAYEIAAGRYPSRHPLPRAVRMPGYANRPIENPGLPPSLSTSTWRLSDNASLVAPLHRFRGTGPERAYLPLPQPQIHDRLSDEGVRLAFPPRPLPRSAIDLDVVMAHCDFSLNKYVRDCLEMLRIGAGLDPLLRVRRGTAAHWHHLYRDADLAQVDWTPSSLAIAAYDETPVDIMAQLGYRHKGAADGLPDQRILLQEKDVLPEAPAQPSADKAYVGAGPTRKAHPTHVTADPACDPNNPRIFHIFWAGPFTDKPYLATLSFLFTQHLGLHIPAPDEPNSFADELDPEGSDRDAFLSQTCRPQLWFWINPGAAASIPNPSARADMFAALAENPWSAPFLHPRFEEIVKFKLWNTTEQLDGVPELRDFWRELPLFNSGGVKYNSALGKKKAVVEEDASHAAVAPTATVFANATATTATGRPGPSPTRADAKKDDEFYERVGSTSASGYDRLSVVLSDMARFVLCHRFGGVYVDADTIFLRDWEELWGWRGAFAYRWSRLEKYNTAVLKLGRNSATGSFLFKTALANGLDFHPMTISRYTKDAHLEPLLLRLPDALFDPAWLNTEYYQRDRPPFPYMKRFEDFFDPPSDSNAAPAAVGFDGFFKGAFSYHFHNFWWIPFDPARNWPDLGPRWAASERKARLLALRTSILAGDKRASALDLDADEEYVDDDQRDLGWATVLKRTFEAYLRGERPNMYGEWIDFGAA